MWVNDLNTETRAIWKLLTAPDAAEQIERWIPTEVRAGSTVGGLLWMRNCELGGTLHTWNPHGPPPTGILELMRAEAHMGTAGTRSDIDVITAISATCWNRRLRRRLDWLIPRVRHWRITAWDYRLLPEGDRHTTWFIDPPYSTAAGRAYRVHQIDYEVLAAFCRSRRGQVIACGNVGETWLPFSPLTSRRVGFNTKHRRTSVAEAVWVRASDQDTRPVAGG